jgi:hypothetical protein
MKKQLITHPFLFAIFPALFLFSNNLGRMIAEEIYAPMILVVILTATFWYLLNIFIKNSTKSGVIISLFWLIFFSYSNLMRFLLAVAFHVCEEYVFLFFLISVFIFILYLVIRTRRDLHIITSILNVVATFLVIMQLVNIGIFYSVIWTHNQNVFKKDRFANLSRFKYDRPNIYYIILDAYARQDTLSEIYDYNNNDFIHYLTKKHFYVAGKSNSNYPLTLLSLASSLNLDYIDHLQASIQNLPDSAKMYLYNLYKGEMLDCLIGENKVAAFLKSQGYTIISFTTEQNFGYLNKADIHIKSRFGLTEFEEELLRYTPVDYLLKICKIDANSLHRKKIIFVFNYLDDALKARKPIFVFAHILCPHPPFVFNSEGKAINQERPFTIGDGYDLRGPGVLDTAEYRKEYRQQLIFVNTMTERMLDTIFSKIIYPAVIILQADHGPRSTGEWEVSERINFKERMGILNAYYFSDYDYRKLYDTISPVNTFRVIFNKYFHTSYELLPDKSYFASPLNLYHFTDVTNQVKKTN